MLTEEVVKSINWIDILVAAIIIRIIYVGFKRGFVVELFKLIGVVLAVFVTLHYFSTFSQSLQDSAHFPAGIANIVAYGMLWGAVILVFKLVRDGLLVLLKIEAHSALDKWGGVILAAGRSVLLASLTLLFLSAATIGYFTKNLEKSLVSSRVVRVAPGLYEGIYDGIVVKFFPEEKLNTAAFTLSDFNSGVQGKEEKR
ncbi:MAG TPA: CvpA family protein [Candidatus Omnitrophota bacterium]|nr:CvpA family protein [Candidatus Omnitrophota bacterium]HPD84048.1 CvpA family protein [Candidatus Omnitrophota bacterium]HRZ02905.1 CvpA family protein [Candidatus Omnitrophota bacterium]